MFIDRNFAPFTRRSRYTFNYALLGNSNNKSSESMHRLLSWYRCFFAFDISLPITSKSINILHRLLVLRRTYLAITKLPSLLGYGWEAKYNVYVRSMTDVLPVPLELMKLNLCGCKTSCNTMRCWCVKNR